MARVTNGEHWSSWSGLLAVRSPRSALVLAGICALSGCSVPRGVLPVDDAVPCLSRPGAEPCQRWRLTQRVVGQTTVTGPVLASGTRIAGIDHEGRILLTAQVSRESQAISWAPVFEAAHGPIEIESVAARSDALLVAAYADDGRRYCVASTPEFRGRRCKIPFRGSDTLWAALSPSATELVLCQRRHPGAALHRLTLSGEVRGRLELRAAHARLLPAEYSPDGRTLVAVQIAVARTPPAARIVTYDLSGPGLREGRHTQWYSGASLVGWLSAQEACFGVPRGTWIGKGDDIHLSQPDEFLLLSVTSQRAPQVVLACSGTVVTRLVRSPSGRWVALAHGSKSHYRVAIVDSASWELWAASPPDVEVLLGGWLSEDTLLVWSRECGGDLASARPLEWRAIIVQTVTEASERNSGPDVRDSRASMNSRKEVVGS